MSIPSNTMSIHSHYVIIWKLGLLSGTSFVSFQSLDYDLFTLPVAVAYFLSSKTASVFNILQLSMYSYHYINYFHAHTKLWPRGGVRGHENSSIFWWC